MTHDEMLTGLKAGRTLVQDSYASEADIRFIDELEREGLVKTFDASLEQETRRKVRWIAGSPDGA